MFNFLVSTGKPDSLTAGVDPADVPRAVAEAALAESDPTAVEALEAMLLAWAAECRTLSHSRLLSYMLQPTLVNVSECVVCCVQELTSLSASKFFIVYSKLRASCVPCQLVIPSVIKRASTTALICNRT